jgi:hypothetical protein
VVRQGAPAFAYAPAPGYAYPYPPTVVAGPGWYNPWVWAGGVWVYQPYRYWYWNSRVYARPGYRPGPYRHPYRHW